MSRLRAIYFLVVVLSLVGLTAWAGVPQLINFQGQLKSNSGSPLVNDTLAVEFKIYDDASAGNVKWSEVDTVITDANGLFTIPLGKKTPVPDSVFNDSLRWLGIKVGSDAEISPRSQLGSVGYSYVSSQWTSAGQDLFRLNGNVGIGTAPGSSVKLDVNSSSNNPSFSIGVESIADNTSSGNSLGIYSLATANTGNAYGGSFYSSSTSGSATGVYGSGGTYGVYGLGNSYGVYARSTGTAAVFGDIGGNFGTYGGYFQGDVKVERNLVVSGAAYMGGTNGVYASASSGPGVVASGSTNGVEATGTTRGVYATGGTYGVVADGGSGTGIHAVGSTNAGYFAGNLVVTGDIIGSAPWTVFPFAAGHENYGFGTQSVQYRKIGDIVYLRGNLKRSDNGNIGGGELLGTLPVGYRPTAQLLFSAWSNTLTINTNGDVIAGYSGPFAQGFDGVFFSTSP